MTGLIDWLAEQHAADEQVANAAIARTSYTAPVVRGIWEADGGTVSNPDAPEWIEATYAEAATHIARHDPQATLARVESERLLAAMHQDDDGDCSVCAGGLNADFDGAEGVPWPCPTLRALAWGYRHREGYDAAWVPESVSADA